MRPSKYPPACVTHSNGMVWFVGGGVGWGAPDSNVVDHMTCRAPALTMVLEQMLLSVKWFVGCVQFPVV